MSYKRLSLFLLVACTLTACAPSAEEEADLAAVESARVSPAIYDKMVHHEALSVYDLASMAHARVNEGVIIRYVRDNSTIYFLSTSDVEMLEKAGLSHSVIDYLLSTGQAYSAPGYYYPGYGYPYGPGFDFGFGYGYGGGYYHGYRGGYRGGYHGGGGHHH